MFDVNEQIQQIESQLKRWEIPGCGLTIVKDGKVLYAGGVGSKDTDGNPITNHTLFQIASCSKAFTAALAAVCATEGLIDFDTPVVNYIPELRLYDEYATMHLTVRDFLSHRSGMPRHEYSWYGAGFTREQLIHNLRYLPMNMPIRYQYQYCNYNYLIVGYLIQKVTGMKFEEAMLEKLIKPLGMENTVPYVNRIEASPDHAVPYGRKVDFTMEGNRPIPYYENPSEDPNVDKESDPSAPAGCIVTCPEDMIKWINFNLNKGKIGDKQLVREDLMDLIYSTHITTGGDNDVQQMRGYGLGWSLCSYRGHKLMEHGGNLPGYSSSVSFIPDLNMGIFLSCNMDTTLLTDAITNSIYDAALGVNDRDWYDLDYQANDAMYKRVVDYFKNFGGTPIEGTSPSHPLQDYVGTYEVPGYRRMKINYIDGQLQVDFNTYKVMLKHYHYDVFATTDTICGELPAGLLLTFGSGSDGSISTITVMLGGERNLKPIVFTKK